MSTSDSLIEELESALTDLRAFRDTCEPASATRRRLNTTCDRLDLAISRISHPSVPDTRLKRLLDVVDGLVSNIQQFTNDITTLDNGDEILEFCSQAQDEAHAIVRDFEKGAAGVNASSVSASAEGFATRKDAVAAASEGDSARSAEVTGKVGVAHLASDAPIGQIPVEEAFDKRAATKEFQKRYEDSFGSSAPAEPAADLVQAMHSAMYPCTGWDVISGATQQKIKKAAIAAADHFRCEIPVVDEGALRRLIFDTVRSINEPPVAKADLTDAIFKAVSPYLRTQPAATSAASKGEA